MKLTQRYEKARRMIPALGRRTYLDNAGAGLPPAMVTQRMESFLDDWSQSGENWGDFGNSSVCGNGPAWDLQHPDKDLSHKIGGVTCAI